MPSRSASEIFSQTFEYPHSIRPSLSSEIDDEIICCCRCCCYSNMVGGSLSNQLVNCRCNFSFNYFTFFAITINFLRLLFTYFFFTILSFWDYYLLIYFLRFSLNSARVFRSLMGDLTICCFLRSFVRLTMIANVYIYWQLNWSTFLQWAETENQRINERERHKFIFIKDSRCKRDVMANCHCGLMKNQQDFLLCDENAAWLCNN